MKFLGLRWDLQGKIEDEEPCFERVILLTTFSLGSTFAVVSLLVAVSLSHLAQVLSEALAVLQQILPLWSISGALKSPSGYQKASSTLQCPPLDQWTIV